MMNDPTLQQAPSPEAPEGGQKSAAMQQLLKLLGDRVSGFLITPPGYDAPHMLVNITPLPGDMNIHDAINHPFVPPSPDQAPDHSSSDAPGVTLTKMPMAGEGGSSHDIGDDGDGDVGYEPDHDYDDNA